MAKKDDNIKKERDGVIRTSLEDVLHNSMIPYAEFVIQDRALPRVEDGLKPVQRRILYTMRELGLTPDKPHKKSVRIVGECLGKFHPHGDTSVYDAMVRMAQPFNMRMKLVDGHGNFGSIDGDPPAAMRYTEARMEPLALELLRDIEKETVEFKCNFDDTLKEPETLPGRYPNLLVNGSSGIAVGLATNIPPHNLGEVIDGVVKYIDNPRMNLATMMKTIKGPDFPTGAYVVAGEELVKAYETGRGKITLRAKISVEQGEYEKKNIVITELPYQVNKSDLLQKIAQLKEDKKDELQGIAEIVDESDRSGIRAVIRVKKDFDAQKIVNLLYKYTQLECTFGINIVVIADGKPQQMGLMDIIRYYVDYQKGIIFKRSKYDLKMARKRMSILDALIIAVKNIDEVIKIIKNASNTTDARQKLKARFKLNDEQAQAILDLRLARLTKLEIYKLEEEKRELQKRIDELLEIINDPHKLKEVLKSEILDIKKKYKDDRRSEIVGSIEEAKIDSFDDVKRVENHVFAYTASGNLKKIPVKNFNNSDKSFSAKSTPEDFIMLSTECQSNEMLMIFTDKGNCYRVAPNSVDECRYKDKGEPFIKVCPAEKDEKPVGFFHMGAEISSGYLIFLTKNGLIKKTEWKEYDVQKSAFQAAALKDGDYIMSVIEDEPETTILYVTKQGMCLNVSKNDIPVQKRISSGVIGINLGEGDEIICAEQVGEEGEIIVATKTGTFKRVIVGMLEASKRARKGVKIVEMNGKNAVVFASSVVEPYELVIEDNMGVMIAISTEDIAIEARTTKGKALKNYKKLVPERCFPLKLQTKL